MARLSDKQGGFTLIEVSTALIFVGFIIFILAATTVNIVRSYNKGIWLAQINQAGQQMNSDIGDKARYSPAATVTKNRRMCINGVSYLWNTQKDIDGDPGNNRYSDGPGTPIRLARIDDPKGEYCGDPTKRPKLPSDESNVHILLGRGATIQEFKVEEQKAGAPLLTISVVVSTEGANRPYKVSLVNGSDKYKEDMANGTWQCGDFIDDHPSNGKLDEGEFTPAKNQYCSFAKYTFTVYERSRK